MALQTPVAPNNSELPQDSKNEVKKSHRKRNTVIVIGAAAAVAASAFGVNAAVSHGGPQKNPNDSSSTSNPNHTSTPNKNKGTSTETGSIPATKLSVSEYPTAAKLVPAYFAEDDAWFNAEGTAQNATNYIKSSDRNTYFVDLLTKSDAQFEDDLIDESKLSTNSNLTNYVTLQKNVHHDTLNLNLLTHPNADDTTDKDAYAISTDITSVKPISESSAQIVAEVTTVPTDNSKDNRATQLTHGVTLDKTPEVADMTWSNVGGDWELSDVTYPNN